MDNKPSPENCPVAVIAEPTVGQRAAKSALVSELYGSSAPHQRILLSVMAVADRHHLDLVPLVKGIAEEQPFRYRHLFEQFADQLKQGSNLEQGSNLAEAIENVPGLLPSPCVLAFRLADDDGTLPEFYSMILERPPGIELASDSNREPKSSGIGSLLLRLFVINWVLAIILLKVVPQFVAMFNEFGVELSDSMLLLMAIGDIAFEYWFLVPLFFLILLVFRIRSFRRGLRRWSPLTWLQPVFSPVVTGRQSLAVLAQSGQSIPAGLSTISNNPALRRLFRKLSGASKKIEQGKNEWKSLASRRVISRRDARALTMTNSGDTQAWILRWTAGTRQRRDVARSSFFAKAVSVAINIVLGLVVVLVAVAIFTSLISIMAAAGR